jgi:hypothetical protein
MGKIFFKFSWLLILSLLWGGAPALARDRKAQGVYQETQGYGSKKPVTSKDEARAQIEKFYGDKPIKIGPIKEKELFFEADIYDKKNNLIDKVIVDKRTGRVRSIY